MAESTISIKPFGKEFGEDNIRQAFKEFAVKRIHVNHTNEEAIVEFSSPNDVEALNICYDDCKVPSLNNAQIGLVEAGFEWPKPAVAHEEEQGLIEIVEVNKDCLISIKECENLSQITDEKILDIFKTFAISKLVRFEDKKEVVIEFQAAGDLETLQITFEDYKIPALGEKAFIDVGSDVDTAHFIKLYREIKKHTTEAVKKEEEGNEKVIQQIKEETKIVEDIQEKREKLEEEQLAERAKDIKEQMEAEEQREQEQREKAINEQREIEQQERERKELEEREMFIKKEQEAEATRLQREAQQKAILAQRALQKEKKAEEKRIQEEQKRIERERENQLNLEKDIRFKKENQERERKYREKKEKEEKEQKEKEEKEQKEKEEKEKIDKAEKNEQERKEKDLESLRLRKQQEELENKEQKEAERRSKEQLSKQKTKETPEQLQSKTISESTSTQKVDYSSSLPSKYILIVLLVWIYYVAIR